MANRIDYYMRMVARHGARRTIAFLVGVIEELRAKTEKGAAA